MEIKIGQRFGSWEVIDFSDRTDSSYNKFYLCKCKCGQIREINGQKLISGKTKSCGCGRKLDMKDKIINDLRFIEPVGRAEMGRIIWKCQCMKCGEISEKTIQQARRSSLCKQSRSDIAKKSISENSKKRVLVDGTCVDSLNQKLSKNNKSGVKGVSWDKEREKWVAQIQLRGINYGLGRFEKLEDAVAARKKAEQELYEPIIKACENDLK